MNNGYKWWSMIFWWFESTSWPNCSTATRYAPALSRITAPKVRSVHGHNALRKSHHAFWKSHHFNRNPKATALDQHTPKAKNKCLDLHTVRSHVVHAKPQRPLSFQKGRSDTNKVCYKDEFPVLKTWNDLFRIKFHTRPRWLKSYLKFRNGC